MAMDAAAAPALKRKDAGGAPELWLDDGGAAADSGFVPVSSRATKIRRLDAEVAPVVPGAFIPPPPTTTQQQPVVGEVRMFGDQVPVGVAAPALAAKRKGEDAPGLWLDDGAAAAASGFPVSTRATKIRRLDAAELSPFVPDLCAPPPPEQQQVAGLGAAEVQMCVGDDVPVIVAAAPNEERAIVLYKPADAARNLLLGPLRPEIPLRVSPDWIHGLKSTVLREASEHRVLFEELACRDESSNSNLAMVPWVPVHSTSQEASTSAVATTEMMDADQDTSMEVEQDGGGATTDLAATAGGGGEAPYHHWPQHHCMMQQQPEQQPLPAVTASYRHQPSPVTWSW
uniref:Uncharacterized protein n=1 Tax=Leersia perrieri TaxID=77586 RepID=A0A0D9XF75_9ORYZ